MNADEAGALWKAPAAAFERRDPIILFNWTPNWVEAKYEGKFADFPDHDPDRETDPSWGTNPDLTHDCGNPTDGYLKIGVHKCFPDKFPKA